MTNWRIHLNNYIWTWLLSALPIVFIGLVVFVLALTNFSSGTYLTGWDNLHPEFDFALSIKRSLNPWQEYQGLGFAGAGHSADLVRQLVLYFFSFIFPNNTLRFLWIIFTVFIGTVGAFYLIRYLLRNAHLAVPFVGALFYLLNLATIQTYYVPFEPFTAHFAALPWLLLSTAYYVQNKNRKSVLFFTFTALLSTPQAYVPTIFIVYLIAMSTLVVFLASKPYRQYLLRALKAYCIIAIVNAFWLLPFLYFTLTNVGTNLNAKINQMATETIILQNKEFGRLSDAMLLRGFWFNNVDPNMQNIFTYMIVPWKTHLEQKWTLAIGYTLFAVVFFGFLNALKSKRKILYAFCALFLFSITMLATTAVPFSWVNGILREHIPLFNQVFRFPFTKFSILASLVYALFFAIGFETLTSFVKHKKNIFAFCLPAGGLFFAILLVVFTLPAFRGNLFYAKEHLVIPQEYFDLFAYFKNQDANTRIANFPQPTFWGWSFYNWGYSGSGILWYGIKQPILDRAFDVWSSASENYYFEVSHALYSKNPLLLKQVLSKYDVSWLIVDKNVINLLSPKALFVPELKELIEQIPIIQYAATFGNIEVYKVTNQNKSNQFVSIRRRLPLINAYTWGDSDQAYSNYGSYISASSPTISYPFRSLFANKLQSDKEFTLEENPTTITFTQTIPKSTKESALTLPSFVEKENIIPIDISAKKNDEENRIIYITIKSPEIHINDKKVSGGEATQPLFEITAKTTYPLNLSINGIVHFSVQDRDGHIGTSVLTTKQDNIFSLSDGKKRQIGTEVIPETIISLSFLQEKTIILPKHEKESIIKVTVPKILDNSLGITLNPHLAKQVKNCDYFRKGSFSTRMLQEENDPFLELSSKNATACISFYIPTLPHEESYAIFIRHKNIKGRGLHFWIANEDEKYAPIATFLPSSKETTDATFILPPMEQFAQSYSVHFENIAIGPDETVNNLGTIAFYPIPYHFLVSLQLSTGDIAPATTITHQPTFVSHPNETTYLITNTADLNGATLILSQSYDPGWKAYLINSKNQPFGFAQGEKSKIKDFFISSFPFVFGKEVKDHVLVNNWSNGWNLNNEAMKQSSNDRIVIVYLPQYLQYIGFAVLFGTFVALTAQAIRRS